MSDDASQPMKLSDRAAALLASANKAMREAAHELKRRLYEDREARQRAEMEREAALQRAAIAERIEQNRAAARAYEKFIRYQAESDVEIDIHDGRTELAHYIAEERQALTRGDEKAAGVARNAAAAAWGHLARLGTVLDRKHERVLGEVGILPETLRSPAVRGSIRGEAADKLQADNGEYERSPARDNNLRFSERGEQRVERIVIVESPMEALAFQQLRPEPGSHFITTGPALTERSRPYLQNYLEKLTAEVQQEQGHAVPVVLAVGKSRESAALGGEVTAVMPAGVVPERLAPQSAQWLDTVMEQQKEYIRAHRIKYAIDRAPLKSGKGIDR